MQAFVPVVLIRDPCNRPLGSSGPTSQSVDPWWRYLRGDTWDIWGSCVVGNGEVGKFPFKFESIQRSWRIFPKLESFAGWSPIKVTSKTIPAFYFQFQWNFPISFKTFQHQYSLSNFSLPFELKSFLSTSAQTFQLQTFQLPFPTPSELFFGSPIKSEYDIAHTIIFWWTFNIWWWHVLLTSVFEEIEIDTWYNAKS